MAGRPPLFLLSAVRFRCIVPVPLPLPLSQSSDLLFQLLQPLRPVFDYLPQGTILFLRRRDTLLQGCHHLHKVTGVIAISLITVSTFVPVLLQIPSHLLVYTPGLAAGRHRAADHPPGLCRDDTAPVVHQSFQQVR